MRAQTRIDDASLDDPLTKSLRAMNRLAKVRALGLWCMRLRACLAHVRPHKGAPFPARRRCFLYVAVTQRRSRLIFLIP